MFEEHLVHRQVGRDNRYVGILPHCKQERIFVGLAVRHFLSSKKKRYVISYPTLYIFDFEYQKERTTCVWYV